MKRNGDIQYVDCGSSIWMSKEDWEILKRWFTDKKVGQELEEYDRRPTISAKIKTRRIK